MIVNFRLELVALTEATKRKKEKCEIRDNNVDYGVHLCRDFDLKYVPLMGDSVWLDDVSDLWFIPFEIVDRHFHINNETWTIQCTVGETLTFDEYVAITERLSDWSPLKHFLYPFGTQDLERRWTEMTAALEPGDKHGRSVFRLVEETTEYDA